MVADCDWSDLPQELAISIANRIVLMKDFTAFGAVANHGDQPPPRKSSPYSFRGSVWVCDTENPKQAKAKVVVPAVPGVTARMFKAQPVGLIMLDLLAHMSRFVVQ
ncbi:hypothetical protein L3X38_044562 [Prunus dulcis]|uniref:Uncharacterized protein n=1 Tax=Prunus dulcis TaxID=3755 RepID=A0AAD4V0C7_PRUDU|nr:hypothetical protein L3X38_044562 [Prunus dulcis]